MQQPTNPLKATYDQLKLQDNGVSYDKFVEKMNDPTVRKATYDQLGLESNGIDYDTFETRLGLKKANEVSGQGSQSTSVTSIEPSQTSPQGYVDVEESTRLAQEMNPGVEPEQNFTDGLTGNLSVQPSTEIGASLTTGVTPGIGGAAPWVGATERNLSERLNQQLDTWEQAHPDSPAPIALFQQLDQESGEGGPGTRTGYLYNNLLQGVGSLANSVVDLALQANAMANVTGQGMLADVQLANYRHSHADDVRNSLVDVIGADMSEAGRERFQGEFLTSALGGLAASVPAMVGNKLRMGRFFLQGYDSALQSLEAADVNNELSNLEKTVYSGLVGTVTANLEKIGFDKIFKGTTGDIANFIANKSLQDARRSGAKITGNSLMRNVKNNLASVTNRYARGGKKAVEGFITEGVTGAAQETVSIGAERTLNYLKGKDIFNQDPDQWTQFINNIKRVGESGLMEAVGGSILGSVSGITSSNRRKKIYDQVKTIEHIDSQLENPEVSDASKDDLLRAKIQAVKSIENEYQVNYDELKNLTEGKKRELGMLNDDAASKEQLIADPSISEEVKESAKKQLEEIDSQIDEISKEAKDTSGPGVLVEAEGKVIDLSDSDIEYLRGLNDKSIDVILDQKEEGKTLELRNNDSADAIIKILEGRDANERQIEIDDAFRAEQTTDTETTGSAQGTERASGETSVKEQQLEVINRSNPAPNEQNTWIRSVDDILTAEEAFTPPRTEGEMYPDFTVDDMDRALSSGDVMVYSSYPIDNGVFVTPSRMNAESYAGDGQVYSKKVPVSDVAWIDEGEGQYAPVKQDSSQTTTVSEVENRATQPTPPEEGEQVREQAEAQAEPEAVRSAPESRQTSVEPAQDVQSPVEVQVPTETEVSATEAETETDLENPELLAPEEASRGNATESVRQPENDLGASERVSAEDTGAQTATGSVNSQGQPVREPSQSVQVKDTDNPQRAAEVLQGSYDRLTEGMTPEQIDADPELVRMRERVLELTDQQKGEAQNEPVRKQIAEKVPLGETPGDSQEVVEGVPEPKKTSGTQKGSKAKTSPVSKEKVGEPTEFRERLNNRESRRELENELSSRIQESDPNSKGYYKDVTDLAITRIVDGSITSSQQLANDLGVPNNSEFKAAFKEARSFVDADAELYATTGRNVDNAKRRAEYGFGPRGKVETVTNEAQMAEAERLIRDKYPVHDLVDRAIRGEGVSDVETAILVHHMGSVEESLIRQDEEVERYKDSGFNQVNSHIKARDQARDDLYNVILALEMSGKVNARALNVRKALLDRDFSLASMISEYRKATQSDTVDPAKMADIESRYKEMSKLMEDIKTRNVELESENARLEAEALIIKQKHQVELNKRKAKKKNKAEVIKDIRDRRQAALEDIKKAWQEMNVIGFAFDSEQQRQKDKSLAKAVRDLINTYIEELVENAIPVKADDVVKKIHKDLKEINPAITRDQVLNFIDSSDSDNRPPLTQLQIERRNFRTELKLIKKIESLEKGGSIIEKARRKTTPTNTRIDELRKRLAELRKYNKGEAVSEGKTLTETRKKIEDKIKEYDRRIKEKDFHSPRKQLILDDPKLKDLRKKLNDKQFDFRVQLKREELNRRSWESRYLKDTFVEAVAIPRTLLATGDLSAPLRQLVFTIASRPKMTYSAVKSMFKFWWSGNTYEDYFHDFRNSDAYHLARKSGLALTDIVPNIGAAAREEQFMSSVVGNIEDKIPLLGNKPINVKIGDKTYKVNGLGLHARAERGFTGVVNKMRIDMFEHGSNLLMNQGKFPDTDIKDYRALATYINAATGRGPVPDRWLGVMQDVSTALFAPRLISSRIYLLSGGPLYRTNSVVRKMYLRDLVGFIGFGMSALAAAALMGADVDDDPTSTDFGMIRVGDRRYDIWGGHTQYIRLFAREMMGYTTSSTGRRTELNSDDWGAQNRMDLLARFGRSKLSPTASLFISAAMGQNYMGEPFSWGQEVKNMAVPLVAQDIHEAWTDYNEGASSLLTVGVPAFFGMGVNTWRANEFLASGVDNDLISLLNDKKLATQMPLENRIKLYNKETGEEENPTGAQFKKYLDIWAQYIKDDLRQNYSEYKKMSDDKADRKFKAIKSAATSYAKEKISGVSQYDLTLTDSGKTYALTPDQLKRRLELNKEYKARYAHRKATIKRNLERKGSTPEMAEIEASKEMSRDARDYSKYQLLKMNKQGEIKLVEKD